MKIIVCSDWFNFTQCGVASFDLTWLAFSSFILQINKTIDARPDMICNDTIRYHILSYFFLFLSLFFSLTLCLSLSLFVSLFLSLSLCLSASLFLSISLRLPISYSLSLSSALFLLSIHRSINLFICLFNFLLFLLTSFVPFYISTTNASVLFLSPCYR